MDACRAGGTLVLTELDRLASSLLFRTPPSPALRLRSKDPVSQWAAGTAAIARACAAVGVPVPMVRQAWALHGIAKVPFDRTAVADGDDLPPMAPSAVPAPVPSETAPEQAEPEPTALDVSAGVRTRAAQARGVEGAQRLAAHHDMELHRLLDGQRGGRCRCRRTRRRRRVHGRCQHEPPHSSEVPAMWNSLSQRVGR